MKKIETKIYIAFISLFILILLISGYVLFNAYETYKENEKLRTESSEIKQSVYQLEYLSTKLNYIGQRLIYAHDADTKNVYSLEVTNAYDELNTLIIRLADYMLLNEAYANLTVEWDDLWGLYKIAIDFSLANNNSVAQNWLIKAEYKFDAFHTKYLQPLTMEGNQIVSTISTTQKSNLQRSISLGIVFMVVSIVGFSFAYYYLRKVLKESIQLKQKLAFLAYHDELTQLPNRRMFQEKVTTAINDSPDKLAVMYMDIDKFKHINDNYGHDIGDLVIQEFARRVTTCIRDADVLGRQGGDEFTLLLTEISVDEVEQIASRIIPSFEQPYEVEGHTLKISTSIGIAFYPENGTEYLMLLKNADDALYEAKKERNMYVISDVTNK